MLDSRSQPAYTSTVVVNAQFEEAIQIFAGGCSLMEVFTKQILELQL